MKRFDICSVSDVEKLIERVSSNESCINNYVITDQLFDVFHDTNSAFRNGVKKSMDICTNTIN